MLKFTVKIIKDDMVKYKVYHMVFFSSGLQSSLVLKE